MPAFRFPHQVSELTLLLLVIVFDDVVEVFSRKNTRHRVVLRVYNH